MRVTKFTDYALRVLIYLACTPRGELTTVSQLAAAYSISVHHVRVVVHKLGQAGYINSTQGKSGGIELARDPTEILIGEVIRDTEKDFFIVECFNPQGSCTIVKACKLKSILGDALNAFIETLDQYTLADITDNRHAILQQFDVA
ncbi:MAG: Rrf2 family transcriptional regulator [Gammaproteobacteria bacterium]|nr:Rrf2 family transcriptional regulator [Gammaproteobacteria bacterium]